MRSGVARNRAAWNSCERPVLVPPSASEDFDRSTVFAGGQRHARSLPLSSATKAKCLRVPRRARCHGGWLITLSKSTPSVPSAAKARVPGRWDCEFPEPSVSRCQPACLSDPLRDAERWQPSPTHRMLQRAGPKCDPSRSERPPRHRCLGACSCAAFERRRASATLSPALWKVAPRGASWPHRGACSVTFDAVRRAIAVRLAAALS